MQLRSSLVALLSFALVLPLAACAADTEPDSNEAPTSASEDELRTQRAPVYLNHLYDVISPDTATAFASNSWFKDTFVDVEVRTTVRPDVTYTGTYLNLRQTYCEFFPTGTFGLQAGVFGVGLGDDVQGGLEAAQTRWKKEFGNADATISTTSHLVNGVQTPWFREIDLDWAGASAVGGMWIMEYLPDAGQTAPRTRLEERSTRYAPQKLARDVTSAVIAAPDSERANMLRSLRSARWLVLPEGAGFVAFSPFDSGVSRRLHVVPAVDGKLGLLAAKFLLNRYTNHTEVLGDALLKTTWDGFHAILTINNPPPAAEALVADDD